MLNDATECCMSVACKSVACPIVSILFYKQRWPGRVFKNMKIDYFLVCLVVWVLFPKFLGRLKSSFYCNCMELLEFLRTCLQNAF